MDDDLERDSISDLPQSIIETILMKLPIRDAVRTSILSTKWRYKWTTLTHLVFDDDCSGFNIDRSIIEQKLEIFITRLLFLHDGPIHKFSLSTSYLQSSPDIDQWLLFLSRKDIKELVLELGEGEWFRAPSCLFSCRKLTRLQLVRCELKPPLNFRGFMCLKQLDLQQVFVAPEVIEGLISGCPLLESLKLSYLESLSLTIRAPNLKYLILEGEFKDISLENTPLLVAMSVFMYMTEDTVEFFEETSGCNFNKVLGGVPRLERLAGHIYFTKYLSIGNNVGCEPIVYQDLKIIELYQVSFEDIKEVCVVLQLVVNSPNLQELHISGSPNTNAMEDEVLNFWEKACPFYCTLDELKVVKMIDLSGLPLEMGFLRFLLENSPRLELMSITSTAYIGQETVDMLISLLRFRRASPLAEIVFIDEESPV